MPATGALFIELNATTILTSFGHALCVNAVVCVLLCASWDVKIHFDVRRGGCVKGGSTWEFDSVCTYLRTHVVCPWSVHVGKSRHKSEPTHKKTCRQICPVGTKIGDISPCRRHVADITSQAGHWGTTWWWCVVGSKQK